MSHEYHGDVFNQYGDHNIGKIVNDYSADPGPALLNLIRLTEALRTQVSAADKQIIDESVGILRHEDAVETSSLRRALQNLAGIASLVGEVGVPVIEAARKAMAALGIG
jgi:hypothetical protein